MSPNEKDLEKKKAHQVGNTKVKVLPIRKSTGIVGR
jgi:hypothetical protein